MKKIDICDRWTGRVLYSTEVDDSDRFATRTALQRAVLTGANLTGAYLDGANLTGAYLDGANLARANLTGANLARANLTGANLARAYLDGANLARANLTGANLARANLDGANLTGANLTGANLARAYLDKESFDAAVPVVPDLDAKILATIESGEGSLDMSQWHTCETTHCRAGWAIALAGEKGKELEHKHGPATAGAFIYWRSTGRVPNFYASDEEALADIVAGASE